MNVRGGVKGEWSKRGKQGVMKTLGNIRAMLDLDALSDDGASLGQTRQGHIASVRNLVISPWRACYERMCMMSI